MIFRISKNLLAKANAKLQFDTPIRHLHTKSLSIFLQTFILIPLLSYLSEGRFEGVVLTRRLFNVNHELLNAHKTIFDITIAVLPWLTIFGIVCKAFIDNFGQLLIIQKKCKSQYILRFNIIFQLIFIIMPISDIIMLIILIPCCFFPTFQAIFIQISVHNKNKAIMISTLFCLIQLTVLFVTEIIDQQY